jgi:hypothetical protein
MTYLGSLGLWSGRQGNGNKKDILKAEKMVLF